MRAVVLIVLSGMTLSLSAAPAPLPRQRRPDVDPALIQGEWVLVEFCGEPVEVLGVEWALSIGGNRISNRRQISNRRESEEWDYCFTLDVRQSPPQIDFSERKKTYRGIYRLSVDTLVLCYSLPEKNRPANFNDPNALRLTFRRKRR
jgi:uncharacterized protein (TIGR03067 family)